MIDIKQMLQEVIRHRSNGNLREAEVVCRQVLDLEPENPDANHFFGILALELGNLFVAKEYVSKAIGLMPQNAACHLTMGNIVQNEGDFEGSMEWYKKVIHFDPANVRAFSNMGAALIRLGRFVDAVQSLEQAIEINPQYCEAYDRLGEISRIQGEYERSLKFYEKALAIMPNDMQARFNRSILFLLKGDFDQGWPEYEMRWGQPHTPNRIIDAGVVWDGSPFEGKTLFVYEEQGMGDTLQFIRYLPLVKQLGGHVIFEVLTPMIRLIDSFKGFDRLWVGIRNVDTRPVDRFDFHIPLLSLPGIFKTTLENMPADTPYLEAEPSLIQIWKKRIKNEDSFKVGVSWAGHPGHTNDHRRSVLLSMFSDMQKIKGIKLFSLQKEKYEKWTDIDPDQIFEQDLGEQISDFADTAAILENMDLVISVDTAVVHLAGALGKPVWTLLPFSPDWRWMLDRDDSPWYPTMRLFRQPAPGDWASVFENVGQALGTLLE